MSQLHFPEELLGDKRPLDFSFPRFTGSGAVLRSTVKLFKDNPSLIHKVVFGLYFPPVFVLYLLTYLTDSPLLSGASGILSWLIFPLLEAALIYGTVVHLRTGVNPPLVECLRWGVKRWWPIFAVSILTGLLTGLGAIFFLIPGIILAVTYSLVVPVVAVEDVGVSESMRRSSKLTEGYRWRIFGTLFIAWLTTTAISWLSSGRSVDAGATPFITGLAVVLTNALLQGAYTILGLVIYLSLRAERDGVASESPGPRPAFDVER